MKILPEPIAFDWDRGNIDKNFKKHNVTSKETEEAFENEPKFFFEDERHSEKEKRYALYGQTNRGRKITIIFTIIFTIRHSARDTIRIISARDMSRKERRSYEEIKENPHF